MKMPHRVDHASWLVNKGFLLDNEVAQHSEGLLKQMRTTKRRGKKEISKTCHHPLYTPALNDYSFIIWGHLIIEKGPWSHTGTFYTRHKVAVFQERKYWKSLPRTGIITLVRGKESQQNFGIGFVLRGILSLPGLPSIWAPVCDRLRARLRSSRSEGKLIIGSKSPSCVIISHRCLSWFPEKVVLKLRSVANVKLKV